MRKCNPRKKERKETREWVKQGEEKMEMHKKGERRWDRLEREGEKEGEGYKDWGRSSQHKIDRR